MFRIIKKLLCDQGGWMAAIPAAMSMVSGIMGMINQSKQNKKFKQTGEEKNLSNFTSNWLNQYRGKAEGLKDQMLNEYITPGLEAAKAGGMFGAIQDAYNPNPTSTELQAVSGQAKQQRNQAMNRGVRGGQLRTQMLNIDQNEARNKLGLMENARQQAAQRGFQSLLPMLPGQNTDIARQQQLMGYDQLANTNWNNLAQMGIQRNLAQVSAANKSGEQSGGAFGGGLMGMIPALGGLFGGGGGAISSAVGGTPSFGMPGPGQGFSPVPFIYGGGSS